MLQKIVNHKVRIVCAISLVVLLTLIRAYEDDLFYDPFLNYFKADYYNLPLPKIDNFQLFLGLVFRYSLNAVISLGVIYALFKDFEAVKFASMLYLLFFVGFIMTFFFVLLYFGETHKMTLFTFEDF